MIRRFRERLARLIMPAPTSAEAARAALDLDRQRRLQDYARRDILKRSKAGRKARMA